MAVEKINKFYRSTVNLILKNMVNIQGLYTVLEDYVIAPPTYSLLGSKQIFVIKAYFLMLFFLCSFGTPIEKRHLTLYPMAIWTANPPQCLLVVVEVVAAV